MSCTKNSYLDSKVTQKNAAKKPAKYLGLACQVDEFR